MIIAIFYLALMGLTIGLCLGAVAKKFKVKKDPIIDEIEAMLPSSNCGQCGFPGCAPAAEALVKGDALVTLCPPGGRILAEKLADKLDVNIDLSNMDDAGPQIAFVREATCIGCTRCFKACPTDAIVGAPKMIHTVVTSACTGCGACIDICPTECLVIGDVPESLSTWRWQKPDLKQQNLAAA